MGPPDACHGKGCALNLPACWVRQHSELYGLPETMSHTALRVQAYHGDRTKADLLSFGDTLAESAGQPHFYIRCTRGR